MRKIIINTLLVVLTVIGFLHSLGYAEEEKNIEFSDTNASVPAISCSAGNFENTFVVNEQSPVFLTQQKDPCPGRLTCMTYFCGGTDKNPYVCCPAGSPDLNHCDCKCYDSTEFECGSYSTCRRCQ